MSNPSDRLRKPVQAPSASAAAEYGGGKWGKYLRAPDVYFRLHQLGGEGAFVPLGEIATIRFGIKTGCDQFFIPEDRTDHVLKKFGGSTQSWNQAPMMTKCKRSEVGGGPGQVRIVRFRGRNTLHPVEGKYLRPFARNFMGIKQPLLASHQMKAIVLFCGESEADLKGTYLLKYLRHGERTSVGRRNVPVAERPSCRQRSVWYDLTGTKRGQIVWNKAQQYRHLVALNQDGVAVNCRLYDVSIKEKSGIDPELAAAVLNSTVVALSKTFFGRYTGTEGALETMVVDVNLMEVPDPRKADAAMSEKLRVAFRKLCTRDQLSLLEPEFEHCESADRAEKLKDSPLTLPPELGQDDRLELDLAVLEMLGVSDSGERENFCKDIYRELTRQFRNTRIVELRKLEQRRGEGDSGPGDEEIAADLYENLDPAERTPLLSWLEARVSATANDTSLEKLVIPKGMPKLADPGEMLEPNTVFFKLTKSGKLTNGGAKPGRQAETQVACANRANAEAVYSLAKHGVIGDVLLPNNDAQSVEIADQLAGRLKQIDSRAIQLAKTRSTDEQFITDLASLLRRWMIHGKFPVVSDEPERSVVADDSVN